MKTRPPPAPVMPSAADGGIDRAKLLAAWISNAETQRAVLRRSSIVGGLAVVATLVQIAVAAMLLYRLDGYAVRVRADLDSMRVMIADAIRANATMNTAEIAAAELETEVEVERIGAALAAEAAPTPQTPTMPRRAGARRAPEPPAPAPPSPEQQAAGEALKAKKHEILQTRKEAAAQFNRVLIDLEAKAQ